MKFTDRQTDGKTHAKIKIQKCCLQDVPAPQIYSCSTVHISAVWVTSAGSPVDIRVSVSRSVPSLVRGAVAAGLGQSSTEAVPDELVLLWRRQTGFGKIENWRVSEKKKVQIFNRDVCFVFFIQFTQNMSHLSAVNDKQVWVNQVRPSDFIFYSMLVAILPCYNQYQVPSVSRFRNNLAQKLKVTPPEIIWHRNWKLLPLTPLQRRHY